MSDLSREPCANGVSNRPIKMLDDSDVRLASHVPGSLLTR
jgi:hypothetical protein